MHKNFRLFRPVISVLMVLCVILTFITFLADYRLFVIAAGLCALIFLIVLIMLRVAARKASLLFEDIGHGILHTRADAFIDSPIPVLTIYEGGEIIWCSDRCRDSVFSGHDPRGLHISEVLPDLDMSTDDSAEGISVSTGGREYTAFIACGKRSGSSIAIVYLVDDTQLKFYTNEYYLTQPSVAIILVDNFEELAHDYKDSERTQLMSEVNRAIEKYVSENYGFFIQIGRDRYVTVIQERGISRIIDDKFALLDTVRDIKVGNRMSVTISVGLGRNAKNLYDSEDMARQALDMSLGRGGDQATVKTDSGYEFYGGVSKGVEKRTKVKTRIIANAMAELIEASGNVVIMGHRFADLDSLGSCVGMLGAVRAMGKPAVICIDRERNQVSAMLQRLLENGYDDSDFLQPADVLEICGPHTLLIIVDTHVPHMTELEDVYRACSNVVVIDHHRRLVGYIENAVIFFHEPYASSTSEMVSELIQYFPVRQNVTKIESEALLAGIMLDTRNFSLRTGVRTFEAAAYLRRQGADTSVVRTLFADSIENYRQRTSLVSSTEIYRGCAIAIRKNWFDGIKIVAPQAADEMMGISGVNASFVIFDRGDDVIAVSARSMGQMNVQLVMEALGGGGHHTMAAAQFPKSDNSAESVLERVTEAIDRYLDSQKAVSPISIDDIQLYE